MKIRYVGRRPRDVVPGTGAKPFSVRPGDVIDVDDATGRSLLAQPVWFQSLIEDRPKPKPPEKKEQES